LKISFLGAIRISKLSAEAIAVKAASTLGYVKCVIKDLTGNLVAKAACTCIKLQQYRTLLGIVATRHLRPAGRHPQGERFRHGGD
jgi:hypothetical protein